MIRNYNPAPEVTRAWRENMEQYCKVKESDDKYAEYCETYREWMNTESNIFRCSECPERKDGRYHSCLPCGQQNCWVEVTCHPERFHF